MVCPQDELTTKFVIRNAQDHPDNDDDLGSSRHLNFDIGIP